jgi:hypothetical protein
MSDKRCPSEAELLSFVDADLPPEQLARIEKHLELCSACAQQTMALSTLVADIAAPLSFGAPLDVASHVAGVMQRLDTPPAVPRAPRLLAWCGALAAAAAALLLLTKLPGSANSGAGGEFTARGASGGASLSRDVGVQLYARQQALVAVRAGSHITAATPLTAGLRNVGSEPAYLLLFAVDAQRAVHWIAPEYTSAGSNPEAFPIAPSSAERLLPSSAVFDDLAPGGLRVVVLLSRRRLHVSDIEGLPPGELGVESLRKRFPFAQVREFSLDVSRTSP